MNISSITPSDLNPAKVLFVDDEENILDGFRRNLGRRFLMDTALGGSPGLELLASQGPYAVVVADMRMPVMDGIEFLQKARRLAPDTVRIMLTGNADLRTAQDAVNQGQIFLFLSKPCSHEDLTSALQAAIRQYQLVTAEKELLERTLSESVRLLTDILGVIEGPCFSRTSPTAELAYRLAVELGAENPWEIRVAAMLAPIGMVTLPPELVARFEAGAALSEEETALLESLPETSAGMLGSIPRLERITDIVLFQSKYFDGTGFPNDGTAGTQIPLGARILLVASALVTLEAAYGSQEAALSEMHQQEGCFDPELLAALVRTLARPHLDFAGPGLARALSELKPMDLLAAPVKTLAGELVVPADVRLSQALLEKLRHHQLLTGIQEPIQVHPAEPPGEIAE